MSLIGAPPPLLALVLEKNGLIAMPFHRHVQHWGTFGLRELVEEIIVPLQTRLEKQKVRITLDIPAGQPVTADRELLGRAVRNLIQNALDAMPHGGSLVATSTDGPHGVELEIADTGASLSQEELEQVFDLLPGAQRGGTGWGMAVVQRIVELHGGSIMAMNCPEGGAAFTLQIPHATALEAAA